MYYHVQILLTHYHIQNNTNTHFENIDQMCLQFFSLCFRSELVKNMMIKQFTTDKQELIAILL